MSMQVIFNNQYCIIPVHLQHLISLFISVLNYELEIVMQSVRAQYRIQFPLPHFCINDASYVSIPAQ